MDTLVTGWLKGGNVTPRDVDPGNPLSLRAQLLRADNTAVVAKFKEGQKTVELTDYQVLVRQINSRKAVKFGEQVRGGNAGSGTGSKPGSDDDPEVQAAVEKFRENAEVFARMATTEDEVVGAFKKRRARDPSLTAEKFYNVGAGTR